MLHHRTCSGYQKALSLSEFLDIFIILVQNKGVNRTPLPTIYLAD